MCASELDYLSCGSTDTTTDIENFVSIFDTNLGSKVMFVTGNSLVKWFTVCESTEMERLSPAVLVEISSKVVVTMALVSFDKLCAEIGRTYCLVRVAYSAFRA